MPRWIEVCLAACGLVVVAPLLGVAALMVKLSSPGPVLFRQARVGRHGRVFTLLKLRSMRVSGKGPGVTAAGDTRITAAGRLMRKLKIDELPELWNVVSGDLALVGPRPEVPQYVEATDPLWAAVLAARPGITDPVTLRLRNEEELMALGPEPESFYRGVLQPVKLRGYVAYLERRTWWTDVVVLAETVLSVIAPALAVPPSPAELEQAPEDLFRLRRWRIVGQRPQGPAAGPPSRVAGAQ